MQNDPLDIHDAKVFTGLFKRGVAAVRTVFPAVSDADAQEIAQDSIIRLIEVYDESRGTAPSTLLHRIALNEAKRFFRHLAAKKRGGDAQSISVEGNADVIRRVAGNSTVRIDESASLDAFIRRGLAQRPKLLRVYDIVTGHDGEMTARQLGTRIGVSHVAANNRRNAMRAAVHDMLAADPSFAAYTKQAHKQGTAHAE